MKKPESEIEGGNIVFNDITFKNGKDDDADGGAIHVSSADSLTFNHVSFLNNYADDNGGAIFVEYTNIEVYDSIFDGNTALIDGGAIFSKGLVSVKNTTFKNNKADGASVHQCHGGAIWGECDVNIFNSTFIGNHAYDYGGAIYSDLCASISSSIFRENYVDDNDGGVIWAHDSVDIIDSIFENNHAYECGGAIFGKDIVSVKNTTFKNNKAEGASALDCDGGAIRGEREVKAVNSTFIGNHAYDYGGAISTFDVVSISSSIFRENYVDDNNGGAVHADNSVDITDSIFENNHADVDGGAIFSKVSVSVKKTIFTNNTAEGAYVTGCYGGAIRSYGNVKVENSTFKGNHAYDNGGAMSVDGTVSISSSIFRENYVDDNDGGAFVADGCVDIIDSIFENNHADVDGGAIFSRDNVTAKNTIFTNNTAKGAHVIECYGGAIRSYDDVIIDNCSFLNNHADDYGGAIRSASVSIHSSYFDGNKVDDNDGGAIYVEFGVEVDNSTFLNNHAYDNGGAIYAFRTTWVASPSYFIGNYVEDNKGGAIYTSKFLTDIFYGDFINNTAKADDDGGAIYINNEDHVTFSHCYFENNRCGDEGGAIYLDSINSGLTLKNNVFVGNKAGDKGNIVYNGGTYDNIEYNWFGKNSFNFDNELVEYHTWPIPDESHSDDHKLSAVMYIDENVKVGNEANLTIYFSNGNTPGDLFNIAATFSADNGAVLSNWHSFSGSSYVTGITLTNTGVTHITGQVNNQVLELDVDPSKGNLRLNVSTDSIMAGDNATVVVTGLKNAKGNVSVFANITKWSGKINYGTAKINVTGLKKSTTLGITFSGDENYNPAWASVDITVYRYDLNITASADSIMVGDNATVVVTGLENATGNVSVFANLHEWTGKINNGVATVIIPNLKESTTAEVIYPGDYTYNLASTKINITVYRYDLNINASAEPILVGENATVIITGLENATGNITVTINKNKWTGKINNGTAQVIVTGLKENTTADVIYNGDYKYNPTSTTVNITVYRYDLNITASAEPIFVGENATVIITGLENATGNITVTINKNKWTGKINNGTAQVIVTGLKENTTADVIYNGDYKYNPTSTTVNITVYRYDLNITASAEPIFVGDNATVIITGLENATGNVSVTVNGKTYDAPIKNSGAEVIIPGLTETVNASVNYAGDEKYNPASTTVNITVTPKSEVVIVAENVTKYYGGSERFVANIYDSQRNPLVNKSVNITINGVKYTRTTDDNGTVSMAINLGSGTYDVTTQVDNTTLKSSITVLSTVIGSDITKYYKNATQYSVKVYDTKGKAVGKGEVVTFNINGIFYNRTTDEKGIATLNINLPPSEYIITSDYKGCKVANNIKVLPVLNASDISMKYLDGTQFKVNLVDGQGNPYKDQFVRFNINGKFYDRLTNSNGQAALNIRLPPGEYIITSSFNGANIANKITITG